MKHAPNITQGQAMAIPASHTPSPAFECPYYGTGAPEISVMWLKDKNPLPVVTEIYVAESPRESDEENQITYVSLPKIPLRLRSLLSDLSLLGTQFFDTLIILQHLVYRRTFSRQPTPGQQQQQHDYRVVHLQTNPEVSLEDLSAALKLGPSRENDEIPLIFPVAAGVWELLVKKPYLDGLMVSGCSQFPLVFREPSKLPKGIVGRTAQIRSVANGKDRWVWGIHLGFLMQFPWNHVMKDTAESMSIHQSNRAVIGSQAYDL